LSRCIKAVPTEKDKNLFLVGTYNDVESSIILCDYEENNKKISQNEFYVLKNERIIDLYPSTFRKNLILMQIFNIEGNYYELKALNYNFEEKSKVADQYFKINRKTIFE